LRRLENEGVMIKIHKNDKAILSMFETGDEFDAMRDL
jgi:hypothetical protein